MKLKQCNQISYTSVKRDSSVGVPTGYGPDGRDLITGKGRGLLSTAKRPDRHPGYYTVGSFYGAIEAGIVKLSARLHLVPRPRMMVCLHSSIRLRGVLLS
jgi:hypothetical protein